MLAFALLHISHTSLSLPTCGVNHMGQSLDLKCGQGTLCKATEGKKDFLSFSVKNSLHSGDWHTITATRLVRWGLATSTLVCTWMGDRCGMSDSPSDETLNRGPLALALR